MMTLHEAHAAAIARWGSRGIAIVESVAGPDGRFTLYLVGVAGPDPFAITVRGTGQSWLDAFAVADRRGEVGSGA